MKTTIKTFHSGMGDCIFLLLSLKKKQFSIMVDCGSYEEPIQKYVKEDLNSEIDLLIITHIDNDHIIGVTEMLSKDVKVNHIIFNCYQRSGYGETQKLDKSQKERLEAIEKEVGLIVNDIIDPRRPTPRSASTAMKGVAATILGRPELKQVWDEPYTLCGMQVDLKEWGMITFLSPTMDEIENLDKEFRQALFKELNVDNAMGKWDKQENMFEILLRYAMLQDTKQVPMMKAKPVKKEPDTMTLEEKLLKAADEPVQTSQITAANQASLAFVWEKDGHRVLVMGDANPDVVVKGLQTHYQGQTFPVLFDAIKVSHHGSHYNTTKELVQCADTEHYFFTGGQELKRPSEAALGRMALCPLPEGLQKRTFHFNFLTSLVEQLKNNKAMKGKYKFSVDTKKNELKFKL